MSEPQAPSEPIDRPLSKEELTTRLRELRSRLGKAFGRNPKIRSMITKTSWTDYSTLEEVYFPKDDPIWHHTISRPSTPELTLRSEYALEDGGLGMDNLNLNFSAETPEIGFIKTFKGRVVEKPNNTEAAWNSANAYVSRLEQQFRPRGQIGQ